jgi:Protein of unknown function (DUF4231)
MSTVKKESDLKLLEVEKLERLISLVPNLTEDQRNYLIDRWLHQIRWWDKRARQASRWYFSLRLVMVIGGILVPSLIAANFSTEVDPWLRLAGSVASLLVAACAGLEALYGWGGFWLEKRRAGELLKVEGWLFFHRAGTYKDSTDRFADFVTRVESQIAAEVGEYVATARKAQEDRAAAEAER